ncbi:hypothetical protein AVEN_86813-1 [Araneus ventricosus]|uniref:Uncharacterized protein n=1 Tax=Araneus ventricosus TaxID=182803 RepID=A0A4Y2D1U5_ARAVE|nr:hypothetical protein AVEN_86813-1 [Araneus ventricosus]
MHLWQKCPSGEGSSPPPPSANLEGYASTLNHRNNSGIGQTLRRSVHHLLSRLSIERATVNHLRILMIPRVETFPQRVVISIKMADASLCQKAFWFFGLSITKRYI